MRPGGACTACPGFSLSRWTAHSRPQYHRHSRTAPPGCNPFTAAHRGRTEPRNRARVHEYRQAPPQATEPPTGRKAGNARKSPGQPHRATKRRRGYSNTAPPGKAPQIRPQRRTEASNPQPRTDTAGNTIYSPTEPRRAGVLSLYYHSRKRRTGAHRAAHRGQAAGGIETPGRASPQPPQPRHSTPGKNPGDFL